MKPRPAGRVVASLTLTLTDMNNGGDFEPFVEFDPVGPLSLGRIDRLLPWLYDQIRIAQNAQGAEQAAALAERTKEPA